MNKKHLPSRSIQRVAFYQESPCCGMLKISRQPANGTFSARIAARNGERENFLFMFLRASEGAQKHGFFQNWSARLSEPLPLIPMPATPPHGKSTKIALHLHNCMGEGQG